MQQYRDMGTRGFGRTKATPPCRRLWCCGAWRVPMAVPPAASRSHGLPSPSLSTHSPSTTQRPLSCWPPSLPTSNSASSNIAPSRCLTWLCAYLPTDTLPPTQPLPPVPKRPPPTAPDVIPLILTRIIVPTSLAHLTNCGTDYRPHPPVICLKRHRGTEEDGRAVLATWLSAASTKA